MNLFCSVFIWKWIVFFCKKDFWLLKYRWIEKVVKKLLENKNTIKQFANNFDGPERNERYKRRQLPQLPEGSTTRAEQSPRLVAPHWSRVGAHSTSKYTFFFNLTCNNAWQNQTTKKTVQYICDNWVKCTEQPIFSKFRDGPTVTVVHKDEYNDSFSGLSSLCDTFFVSS